MDFEKLNEELAALSVDEFSKWEESALGIRAMHARIVDYGYDLVSDPPKDWAIQLVGILGCGYSGVTRQAVQDALIEEGWMEVTITGALAPWGGSWVDKDNDHED